MLICCSHALTTKVLSSDETVAWLNEHYENNQMMIDVFFSILLDTRPPLCQSLKRTYTHILSHCTHSTLMGALQRKSHTLS